MTKQAWNHIYSCDFINTNECTCAQWEEAFLRQHYPNLFTMEPADLRREMYNKLYDAMNALRAMTIRGTDDKWWSAQALLDWSDPIMEEHGWEGIGR
jgi:hypothetical protein